MISELSCNPVLGQLLHICSHAFSGQRNIVAVSKKWYKGVPHTLQHKNRKGTYLYKSLDYISSTQDEHGSTI